MVSGIHPQTYLAFKGFLMVKLTYAFSPFVQSIESGPLHGNGPLQGTLQYSPPDVAYWVSVIPSTPTGPI